MKPLLFVVAIVTIFSVGYASWRVERWINWKLYYQGKVESFHCGMPQILQRNESTQGNTSNKKKEVE